MYHKKFPIENFWKGIASIICNDAWQDNLV